MARGKMNIQIIENDLIIGTLIFILYLGIRSGIHHHRGAGIFLSFIFITAGTILSGTDGILLILGGLGILLISVFQNHKEQEENE